jgi:hypothetical protein
MKYIISLFLVSLCFLSFSQRGNYIKRESIKNFDSLKIVYPNFDSKIEKTYFLDVTGDGFDEEVIYTYELIQDTFFVSRTIIEGKSKSKINFEQIDFSKDFQYEVFFDPDSLFFDYFPYSGLNELIIKDISLDFEEPRFHDEEFMRDPVVLGYISKYEKGFKGYMLNYKGKMILSPLIMSGQLLIWYEPKKEFRVIYAS